MTLSDWLAGLFYLIAIVGFFGGTVAVMVAIMGNAFDQFNRRY